MDNHSMQYQPCGEAVRGLTVDRIVARIRAIKAEGTRLVVNLRCGAAVNVDCDDAAMLSHVVLDRGNDARDSRAQNDPIEFN